MSRAEPGLPGQLTPDELAQRLGWAAEVVSELIDEGLIVKLGGRWVLATSDGVGEQWARALRRLEGHPDEGE